MTDFRKKMSFYLCKDLESMNRYITLLISWNVIKLEGSKVIIEKIEE